MEQIIYFIFQACVEILYLMGNIIGLGYRGINVVIFCIIWPLFTVWLIWLVIKQKKELKNLRNVMLPQNE